MSDTAASLDGAIAQVAAAVAADTPATRATADQWAAGARRLLVEIGVPVTAATTRAYLAATMAAYELIGAVHPVGSGTERVAHARVIGGAVLAHEVAAAGAARRALPD